MTTGDFLPEYRAVPTSNGWRPSFRRFVGERERLVPFPNGPRYFATKDEARDAAKEYLRGQFNTPVTGCVCETPEHLDEVAEWRQRKEEEAAIEIRRVFGDARPISIRDVNGREIAVERKRRRA